MTKVAALVMVVAAVVLTVAVFCLRIRCVVSSKGCCLLKDVVL